MPFRILSIPTSMRRALVASCLGEMTQQIHSLRARGVMSRQVARAAGSPELAVPRIVRRIAEIPLLGSGKTDYVALKRMAEAAQAGEE